jgi:uroporphyrin-III C-methyltransferase
MKTNKLTIVGAGPGDAELITVKGLNAIRNAKVILYDALVSTELLRESDKSCKHVYVGKRRGQKEFAQEEINQLLVFYAKRFEGVVRLKGGDPFIFGRGHEELEYAKQQGVEVEVIPGISSAYAAPLSAGISLTKRGVNESFWVVTGTLSSGEISGDIINAAESSATIVILMGLHKLEQIAEIITRIRGELEPMAIIQNATLQNQKVITAKAGSIVEKAIASNIGSPAVIVIGKVVNLNALKEAVKSEYVYQGLDS